MGSHVRGGACIQGPLPSPIWIVRPLKVRLGIVPLSTLAFVAQPFQSFQRIPEGDMYQRSDEDDLDSGNAAPMAGDEMGYMILTQRAKILWAFE